MNRQLDFLLSLSLLHTQRDILHQLKLISRLLSLRLA